MNEIPIVIVTPATASSNNGNWHTAARWRSFLSLTTRTEIVEQWDGEPASAMIALHARRSAESIARFHLAYPNHPLALVLTGTDIYGDMGDDAVVQHSLACASHLVVLQEEALTRLSPADCAKARTIVQSAARTACADTAAHPADFVAVGHLRDVKDPLTLMQAARLLAHTGIRIVHIGDALDARLASEARRTMGECPNYRWLGGQAQSVARQWMACARAFVHMSKLEGGANVVIEAVRSKVPVLASRIDGNVGLLGADYEGYFPVGDSARLAQLMQSMVSDLTLAGRLRAQCAMQEERFSPAAEQGAVLTLLGDMLDGRF